MNQLKNIFIVILMSLCAVVCAQESYHGMRVSSDSSTFEIVFVSTENEMIQLGFSIPVNPNSFKAENISLNGSPLAAGTPIKFNKTGKIIEITKSLPAGESVLALKEILSFDNQTIASVELDGLRPGETKDYSFK